MSSLQPTDSSSDSESNLSSDSDSDSDVSVSDSQEGLVTLGGPKKPNIHRIGAPEGSEGLKARIAAFLPQLEEANGLLLSEGGQYSMEDVEDGEQHIEMNLGLGVLEEQQQEADTSDDNGSDSSDEVASDGRPGLPVYSGPVRSPSNDETRYMDALKGRHTEKRKSGIEEVG